MRSETLAARRRLYLLARVLVARHYRRELTLEVLARSLSSSPRQLQRVYAEFGHVGFREDLRARRMTAAAELLVKQRSIPVADVARLVGYSQPPHFSRAFRRHYGTSPGRFREAARSAGAAGAPLATGAPALTGGEPAVMGGPPAEPPCGRQRAEGA